MVGERIGEFFAWISSNRELVADLAIKVGMVVAAFVAFAPVLTVLGSLAAGLGGIVSVVGTVVGVLGGWTAIWGGITTAVGVVVGILGGPLTLGIAALIAIVVGAKTAWESNFMGIRDTVTGAVAAVTGALSSIGPALLSLGSKFLKLHTDAMASLASIIGSVLSWGGELLSAFGSAIAGAVVAVVSGFAGMVATVVSSLGSMVAVVGSQMAAVRDAFVSALAAIGDEIRLRWDSYLREVSDKLDAIWGSVTDGWSQISTAFGSAFDSIWSALTAWGASIVSSVSDAVEAVRIVAQSKLDLVRALFHEKMAAAAEAVRAVLGTLAGFMTAGLGVVISAAVAVWARIQSVLVEPVRSAVLRAGEAVRGLTDRFRDVLGTVISFVREKALEIGTNIVAGIQSGITGAWGAFREFFTSRINNIIEWALSLLGIASPSTVFAAIAKWIMAGLESGILKHAPAVLDALVKVTGAMSQVVRNSLSAVSDLAAFEMPAGLERLKSVFKSVLSVVGSLASELLLFSNLADEDSPVGAVSQAFSSVARAASDLVSAVADISGLEAVNLSSLPALKQAVRDIAAAAVELFGGGVVVAGMDGFRDSVVSMADVLQAVADLNLSKLSAIGADSLAIARTNIVLIADLFGAEPDGIARAFARLADDVQERTAGSLQRFAEGIGSLFDLMGSVRDVSAGWEQSSALTAGVLAIVRQNITAIVDLFGGEPDGLARAFASLDETVQGSIEGSLKRFASGVGSVVDLFAKVAGLSVDWSAVSTISDTALNRIRSNIADMLLWFDLIMNDIQTLDGLFGSRIMETLANDDLPEWLKNMGSIVDLFAKAGGLSVEWSTVSRITAAQLDIIRANVVAMMRAAVELRDDIAANAISLDDLEPLATLIEALAGPLSAFAKSAKEVAKLAGLDTGAAVVDVQALASRAKIILDALVDVSRDISSETASKAALIAGAIGPAAEGLSKSTAVLTSFLENPFYSASRRVRGARTSSEFASVRTVQAFAKRMKFAIGETVRVIVDGLSGVNVPADLGDRMEPLAKAAEALRSILESLQGLRVPSNLSQVFQAMQQLQRAVGGGAAGPGGLIGAGGLVPVGAGGGAGTAPGGFVARPFGGGGAGAVRLDNVNAKTATLDRLGISLRFQIGSREFAGAVVEAFQSDVGSLDDLITLEDRRRASTGTGGP